MADDLDLPIAVRRPRRASLGPRSITASTPRAAEIAVPPSPSSPSSATPSRKRRKQQHVRFSDPGPADAKQKGGFSTGLTPIIRRTTLTGRFGRRHSTPSARSPKSGTGVRPCFVNLDNPQTPFSGEVNFLPLRQVLDGRIKRRIRRNGLSEEMNAIASEKKTRAREARVELDRLRASVAEKDERIRRLHDETVGLDDVERMCELEKEVELLKKELAERAGVQGCRSPGYGWATAGRDPFSDEAMELNAPGYDDDDDHFGETTMANLMCSTPARKEHNASAASSFPTPPATSPVATPTTCWPPTRESPLFGGFPTPRLHSHDANTQTRSTESHAGIQTSLPDPEKEQLEDELASLQLEVSRLTTTLESYAKLASRVSDKLTSFAPPTAAGEPGPSSSPANIETCLDNLLRTLSDRTAAMIDLNASLGELGFPGADAFEILSSLSSAFRTARLELEYLTPGESALPLTSAGAAVLGLLLDRLRGLTLRVRECDGAIDEYHALESSLRKQLRARTDAMDEMSRELAERDAHIADLETGLDHLKGAADRYARDVSGLEGLAARLGGELADREAARGELEAALSAAAARTADLEAEIASLRAGHAAALEEVRAAHRAQTAALGAEHGRALAGRDARVAGLRGDVESVSLALREARETVRRLAAEGARLREENDGLEAALEEDHVRARGAIGSVRAELERVVRMSEGLLATPRKRAGRSAPRGGPGQSASGEGGEDAAEAGVLGVPADAAASEGLGQAEEGADARAGRRTVG